MVWIKTVRAGEASDKLRQAISSQARLYPREYGMRVEAAERAEGDGGAAGVVGAHTLLPDTLYHAFSTYGSLLSPDLPLTRRQHELIAVTVSVLNDCFY